MQYAIFFFTKRHSMNNSKNMQFLLSAIGLLVNMNLVFCVFYAMSCGLVVWLVVYAINISGCFVLFGTVISILMKRKEEEGDVRYQSIYYVSKRTG